MSERDANRIGIGVVLLVTAGMAGCGGAASKSAAVETTPESKPEVAYDYQAFAPLPEPVKEGEVPFLLGPGGIERMSCFEKVEGIKPVEGDAAVRMLFEKHSDVAKSAVAKWVVNTLVPGSVTASTAEDWKIEIDDTAALEVTADKMRFMEKPECLQQATVGLPEGMRVVTALYGARTFRFQADPPLKADVKDAIVNGARNQDLTIESDDLREYQPLKDDKGEAKLDDKKQPLYTAPDGTLVPENKVPPPEKRTMSSWTLKSKQTLFFAFHELSKDAWKREADKGVCDVVLVWGDAAPRAPECEQYTASTFLAKKLDSGDVEITIKTGKDSEDSEDRKGGKGGKGGKSGKGGKGIKKVTMSFDNVQMVQINDRIMLWINAEKAGGGLGVKLRIDSLQLNP